MKKKRDRGKRNETYESEQKNYQGKRKREGQVIREKKNKGKKQGIGRGR